ncbi:hypothetical protein GCM10011529_15390 [Polymorphobacter glacialis]|uniref:Uncharacterized protein n=1 Tax=Sandarakinorhabdus glacialis TaxID=1614636 RepID=A0A917E8L5_9SPHN|nr:hypothetical protein [Polymorphobacter glacialis]GGE09979.1 hypothetical protein GCM10011529_15390 [Polymorphobacter glacialis]
MVKISALPRRIFLSVMVSGLAACATTPPPPPPPPIAPPAPPPPGLGLIIGSAAPGVIALLGAASLDRSEGPARQLQFVRPPCVLDVFLYPGANGVPLVRTAAARKADGSRIDPGVCLGLITPVRR